MRWLERMVMVGVVVVLVVGLLPVVAAGDDADAAADPTAEATADPDVSGDAVEPVVVVEEEDGGVLPSPGTRGEVEPTPEAPPRGPDEPAPVRWDPEGALDRGVGRRGPGVPVVPPGFVTAEVAPGGGRVSFGESVPVSAVFSEGAVGAGVQVRLTVPELEDAARWSPLDVAFGLEVVDALGAPVVPLSAPVVEIDYSGFVDMSRGGLGERLEVMRYGECVDSESRCDAVKVAVVNDTTAGVLSFEATDLLAPGLGGVALGGGEAPTAGGGGGGGMYALGSGGAGASGSFQATPMPRVLDYQVGLYAGSFDTSYPIPVPPPAAGSAPAVGFGYSSASIDGMNTDTNNQASTVGLGWSLAAGGSIQRHYKTCGIEFQAPGDLCPIGHEYTLTLNGTGSRLVKKTETGTYVEFRLQSDPMWRIRMYDGASNPDSHGEYWIVTTPDGTEHRFGYEPDAVDWVPVYTGHGNDDPFSCDGHRIDPNVGHLCQKAWRWNLDRVTDTNGNQIDYSYVQENGFYEARGSSSVHAEYIRASHLREVTYTTNGSASITPTARVRFVTEVRCSSLYNATDCDADDDLPDAPVDLACREEATECDDDFPSFFSERRLTGVVTQVKDSAAQAGGWRTVGWWDLIQSHPEPTQTGETASEPKLWLDKIVQRPGGDFLMPGFEVVEAEDYSTKSGTALYGSASDYGQGGAMTVNPGSRLDFDRVGLSTADGTTGAAKVVLRYASNGAGSVEVYSTTTSTLLGTIPIANQGGFNDYATVEATLSGAEGTHDIYLKAVGTTVRFNWFRFSNGSNLEGLPGVEFDAEMLPNRVAPPSGVSPMRMPRVVKVLNELGGAMDVTYGQEYPWVSNGNSSDPCDAAWTGGDVRRPCDFFVAYDAHTGSGGWVHWNKWKVEALRTYEDNGQGASFTESAESYTTYEYSEPTWHYSDKPGHHSHTGTGSNFTCDELPCNHWNEFRGHAIVEVRVYQQEGGQELSRTEHRFHQGMNNDWNEPGSWSFPASITLSDASTRTDAEWLQGRTVETRALAGNGTNLTRTVLTYDHFQTANDGARLARWVGTKLTEATTYGTPNRVTKTQITYDQTYGTPVREFYDGSDTAAHSNVEREFHANTTDWIVALPKWEKLRAGHATSGALASHTLFYYDGSSNNATTPSVGNLTKVRAYDTATTYVDTVYTYDAGRLATVTDPESNTTTTVYDSTFGYPEEVTNPELESTGMVADPGTGAPVSVTDPAGFTTEYEYDDYGRLIAVELPGDDTDDYVFTYSPGARPARVKTRQLVEESPAVWIDSYGYVDGFGRTIQTQTNHETSGQRIITATYFDARGLARRVSVPWQVSGNAGTGWVDPTWTGATPTMPQQTVATYDRFGRVTLSETLRSNGNLLHDTATVFDGWDSTVTDPRGAATTYEHDAFGNLSKVTDDNGFVTSYTYTTRLELDMVTRDGHVTDVDYDLLGRKTSLDDPDMGEWFYTYFDNGLLETQSDARGTTLMFGYDGAGRMISKLVGGVMVAEWVYDAAGRLERSRSWTDSGGLRVTIDYGYETAGTDKRGRLTSTAWTTQGFGYGTDTYSVGYGYDNADRVTTTAIGDGAATVEAVTRGYDTRSGRPVSLTGTSTYMSGVVWTSQGLFESGWSQWGSSKLYRSRVYSGDTLQLSQIKAGTSAGGSQVAQMLMWWSGFGDLSRVRDVKNGDQNQCFTYDSVGRLTVAYTSTNAGGCDGSQPAGAGAYSYTYTYQGNGNLDQVTDHLTATTQQYTYGAGTAGPHAVTAMGGTSYLYDLNGNQTSRGDDLLTWDGSNRLEEYDPPGAGSTKFLYDADGVRVVRIDPDGTATTSIGGVYEKIQGGATAIQRVTYRFNGDTVAVRTIQGASNTLDWVVTDHLGSTTVTRNASTGATVRQWYAPYGAARASSGGSLPTEETYTGQTSDASTGLMHYNARYYDPTLRRFISADTIIPNPADPADHNRYTYVGNSPLIHTDPSGHCRLAGTSTVIFNGSCNGINTMANDGTWIETQPTMHNPGYQESYPTPGAVEQFFIDVVFGWVDDAGTVRDPEASGLSKTLAAAGLLAGPVSKGFKLVGNIFGFAAHHGDEVADAVDAGVDATKGLGARFIVNTSGDVLDTARVTIPEGKFGYLLENPSKSGVFADSMGFDAGSLDNALRTHLADNFETATSAVPMVGGGSKFSVTGAFVGPSGEKWTITSVWGVDLDGTIRLITATP